MRSLGNIARVNSGADSTGFDDIVERITQPLGDGQLLNEAQRRGLVFNGQLTPKGSQALQGLYGRSSAEDEQNAVAAAVDDRFAERDQLAGA